MLTKLILVKVLNDDHGISTEAFDALYEICDDRLQAFLRNVCDCCEDRWFIDADFAKEFLRSAK